MEQVMQCLRPGRKGVCMCAYVHGCAGEGNKYHTLCALRAQSARCLAEEEKKKKKKGRKEPHG